MPLTVAVQMDPIARIRIAGDSTFALLLEAQARGHRLLHYTPERLRLNGSRVEAMAEPLTVKDVEGDHAAPRGAQARRPLQRRRGAPAAGPALRSRLCDDDASPRAHSPEDARRQRSEERPRRAGEALCHGFPGAHAADPHRPRPRRDRGLPRRARRGRDEAALRFRRRAPCSRSACETRILARCSICSRRRSANPG